MSTSIPACSKPCLQTAIEGVGCKDLTDIDCFCAHNTQLSISTDTSFFTCVLNKCPAGDYSSVSVALTLLCFGTGHSDPYTFSIPSYTLPSYSISIPSYTVGFPLPTDGSSASGANAGTEKKSGLSAAAKGGIAGGVVGAVLLAIVAFLLFRQRRKAKRNNIPPAPLPIMVAAPPPPPPVQPPPPTVSPAVSSVKTYLPISSLGPVTPASGYTVPASSYMGPPSELDSTPSPSQYPTVANNSPGVMAQPHYAVPPAANHVNVMHELHGGSRPHELG